MVGLSTCQSSLSFIELLTSQPSLAARLKLILPSLAACSRAYLALPFHSSLLPQQALLFSFFLSFLFLAQHSTAQPSHPILLHLATGCCFEGVILRRSVVLDSRSTLPADQLLFATGVERWTLDTKLTLSPLLPAAGYAPQYSSGLLANLEEVRAVHGALPCPAPTPTACTRLCIACVQSVGPLAAIACSLYTTRSAHSVLSQVQHWDPARCPVRWAQARRAVGDKDI